MAIYVNLSDVKIPYEFRGNYLCNMCYDGFIDGCFVGTIQALKYLEEIGKLFFYARLIDPMKKAAINVLNGHNSKRINPAMLRDTRSILN